MPISFSATPEARLALERIVEANGPVMFHLTSGRTQSRCPVCLPADELRIGARDRLIGHIEGIPIYEMISTERDGCCSAPCYVLDVERGLAIGFSYAAALGARFVLRPQYDTATN